MNRSQAQLLLQQLQEALRSEGGPMLQRSNLLAAAIFNLQSLPEIAEVLKVMKSELDHANAPSEMDLAERIGEISLDSVPEVAAEVKSEQSGKRGFLGGFFGRRR